MNVVEIDRKTGMRSQGGPDTILEAFKPGTGPADSYQVIGLETVAIQAEEQRKHFAARRGSDPERNAGRLF
jgi:penicillin-binding protein 1A